MKHLPMDWIVASESVNLRKLSAHAFKSAAILSFVQRPAREILRRSPPSSCASYGAKETLIVRLLAQRELGSIEFGKVIQLEPRTTCLAWIRDLSINP